MFSVAAAILDELTDTVTSYLNFCVEMCIPTKTVTIHSNNKTWFSKDVKNNPSLSTYLPPSPPPTPSFYIQEEQERTCFLKSNKGKAAAPDGVSPAVLKHCAYQLAPTYTNIFNSFLSQCMVPKSFKDSVITPVPKNNKISCLNDYRPIALTSVIMKSFERIKLSHLKQLTTPHMDRYQFAYSANRSVEDAINLFLHKILHQLKTPHTYARVLFIDIDIIITTNTSLHSLRRLY